MSTLDAMRREGRMPAPFNADWGYGYRWSLAVIEAYEQQAVGA